MWPTKQLLRRTQYLRKVQGLVGRLHANLRRETRSLRESASGLLLLCQPERYSGASRTRVPKLLSPFSTLLHSKLYWVRLVMGFSLAGTFTHDHFLILFLDLSAATACLNGRVNRIEVRTTYHFKGGRLLGRLRTTTASFYGVSVPFRFVVSSFFHE